MKMSEYKQLFLSEAQEILDALNKILVELEKEPENKSFLHELFRRSHTLKSMAQSMGYEDIVKLTHSMESALTLVRSGRLKIEKGTVDLLFQSVDTLDALVGEAGKEKAKKVEISPLVKRFSEIAAAHPTEKKKLAGEEQKEQAKETRMPSSPGDVLTVRIPLTQLDTLMDVAGELVINKERLIQIGKTIENKSLDETVALVSSQISQLRDQMNELRLVPLEYIFRHYYRLVRNMAVEAKVEVDLILEGSDISLDRTIQDEINEPLLHLLKNAVIHGIEKPEERKRLKKPVRGKIKLIARRERNHVTIELLDDGRGIDIAAVKELAVKKGLLTSEDLSTLTDKEILMLITNPGYSGSKKVTEGAGRGVGLNVVRTKVQSFGGTLEMDTRLNEGTTFRIKLPLSMAIVQAMLVGMADETYCIPLSHIVETIKVSPDEIKHMEHHEMISYRDTVLPMVRLKKELGVPIDNIQQTDSDREAGNHEVPVVVVESGTTKLGVVVDSLLGQQEVVIKSLSGVLTEYKYVSGATVLGTGKVAFILDVPSMV